MEYLFIYFLIGCIVWLYAPDPESGLDHSIRLAFDCIVLWGWWLLVIIFMLIFNRK